VSLALAAVAARWQPRLLPLVEIVQDWTSQGVRVRFFGEGVPGAVRQFVSGTERLLPVTVVDSGGTTDGRRSARLILAVPEDAALARSTVKATTVLSGDAGTLRRLSGRVVLISHTGLDTKWPVAGGRMVPGLYLHAAATQLLISGQAAGGAVVSRPSIAGGWVILLGAACVGAVLPGVARRVRPWGHGRQVALSSGVWLVAAIGIVVVALVGAAKFSYVVMPAVPLAAMAIAGGAAVLMQAMAFRAVRS
jgi:CHASE2 domain-containing sensor protein